MHHPTSFPPVLGALDPYPKLADSLVFQLNGLIVVFVALGSIWGAMELIGWFFKRQARRATAAPPQPVASPPPAAARPAEEGWLDPRTVAAVTAAVHFTVGTGYRIRAIAASGPIVEWAQEGRRQIFASHRVR